MARARFCLGVVYALAARELLPRPDRVASGEAAQAQGYQGDGRVEGGAHHLRQGIEGHEVYPGAAVPGKPRDEFPGRARDDSPAPFLQAAEPQEHLGLLGVAEDRQRLPARVNADGELPRPPGPAVLYQPVNGGQVRRPVPVHLRLPSESRSAHQGPAGGPSPRVVAMGTNGHLNAPPPPRKLRKGAWQSKCIERCRPTATAAWEGASVNYTRRGADGVPGWRGCSARAHGRGRGFLGGGWVLGVR